MWMFIGFLSLIASIVFLILSVVSRVKNKDNAKKNLKIAGISFVVFIVALIASPDPKAVPETSAVSASPTIASSAEASKAAAADQKAEEAEQKSKADAEAKAKAEEEAKKNDPVEVAKKVAAKKFDSVQVTFNEQTGHILVTAAGRDNLTQNMIHDGMMIGITDSLKGIKDVKAIKDASFNITFPMVDKFGNESESIVMKASLSADTRIKINWENFTFSNLPKIADSYWEHPSFSK